jgi:hypothetical protein
VLGQQPTHSKGDGGADDVDLVLAPCPLHTAPLALVHVGVVVVGLVPKLLRQLKQGMMTMCSLTRPDQASGGNCWDLNIVPHAQKSGFEECWILEEKRVSKSTRDEWTEYLI